MNTTAETLKLLERIRESTASRVDENLFVGDWKAPMNTPADLIVLVARELPYDRFCCEATEEILRAPLDDNVLTADEQKLVRTTAGRILSALNLGKRVLITCHLGLNRSALIAALVLCHRHHWSAERAIARLRRHRGAQALNNWSFVWWLHKEVATCPTSEACSASPNPTGRSSSASTKTGRSSTDRATPRARRPARSGKPLPPSTATRPSPGPQSRRPRRPERKE